MSHDAIQGVILCWIPCHLAVLLAIFLIWGTVALGWALLINVALFVGFVVWLLF